MVAINNKILSAAEAEYSYQHPFTCAGWGDVLTHTIVWKQKFRLPNGLFSVSEFNPSSTVEELTYPFQNNPLPFFHSVLGMSYNTTEFSEFKHL